MAPMDDNLASPLFLNGVRALRLADIMDVAQLRTTETETSGRPINRKDRGGGGIMTWVAPTDGLRSAGNWRVPILAFWNVARSQGPARTLLGEFPFALSGFRKIVMLLLRDRQQLGHRTPPPLLEWKRFAVLWRG